MHLIAPDQLNTYDVLVNDDVVFTERRARRLPGRSDRQPRTGGPRSVVVAGDERVGLTKTRDERVGLTKTRDEEADQ